MKKNVIIFFCFCFFLTSKGWCENSQFSKKMLKEIKIMEKRHFKNQSDLNDSEQYRLSRLENELMGKTFDNETFEKRFKRLKIASQKRMLQGASMPSSIKMSSSKFNNDSIEVIDKNNLGIIDGLMKLYAPKAYKFYIEKNERLMRYDGY